MHRSTLGHRLPGREDGAHRAQELVARAGREVLPRLLAVDALVRLDDRALGIRADYFVPVLRRLSLGVFATYEYRHYYEAIPGDIKNRRDPYFAPGAQFIAASVFADRLDLVGSYTYELRGSNDGFQNYGNHVLSLRWVWRF